MHEQVDLKEKIEATNSNDFDNGKIPAAPVKEEGAQDNVPDNGAWETQLFQVYNGNASLKYPHLEPGGFTEQYTLEPSRLPLQEGVAVIPDTAQVSAYNTKERKGVVFTALGGSVEIAITNLPVAVVKAQLAVMNIIADHFIMDKIYAPGMEPANLQQAEPEQVPIQTNDTEISAYLREPIKIESLTGINIALDQGEYVKNKNDRDPKLKFWKTTLDFTKQKVQKECVTELDETGLHTLEKQNVRLDKQEAENISAEQVLESLNEPGEQPEPEPQWEEFKPGDLTEDGFVRMEEAESQVVTIDDKNKGQIGKAKFRFNEIPYTIPLFNKRELKGKTKPKEAGDTMQDFFVDSTGKLYATFKEPIELTLIGNEKIEQYIIAAIVLEGVSIKDSQLTAEKIRIDFGKKASEDEDEDEEEEQGNEQSDKEKAKKLFGENIHGTIANISAVSSIDKGGIHAAPGKKSLGGFGVSKFLGFLDVEGDYPTGYLKVSFENQKKADKPKLFSETVQNLMGDGLCIPIFGPLAFEICISPSVSIGGSLSAEMRRGKSFGDDMKPGESMNLAGKAGINGEGKLDMSAGFALTSGVLGSVKLDIKLGSELSAGIGVEAEADTALGLRDGKIKQTKEMNLNGKVNIKLKGEVNLSSSVKFFVWKGTLFKVELCSKEVNVQPFQGHAWREVDAEGLMQGWHFESMKLSAKELGQEIVQAIRNTKGIKKVDEQKLEMSKKAADSLGKEVESAWILLEELSQQDKLTEDRAYLVDEKQKAALQNRIKDVTKDVQDKIIKYMDALSNYKGELSSKERQMKEEVEKAGENRYKCMERDSIRQTAMMDIQKGGFQFERYKALTPEENGGKINKEDEIKNKMAAIDFTIARAIGIYDYKLEAEKSSYDLFVKKQNLKRQVDRRHGKSPSYEYMYPMVESLSDKDFVETKRGDYGMPLEQLRSSTQFGSFGENYFDILWKDIPYNKLDGTLDFLKKRNEKSKGGKDKEESSIKVRELLKILVSGVYPKETFDKKGNSLEGKPIPKLDAEKKNDIYKDLFKDYLTTAEKERNKYAKDVGKKNEIKKTELEYMMDDINKVLQALFESDLDTMVTKGNINMEEKLKELDDKIETSKTEYLKAVENQQEVVHAIAKVEEEQKTCLKRLNDLKSNTNKGLKLNSKSVEAAKAAVNFMQNEYMDVANGVTLVRDAVTDINKDSDAYERMQKIEEEVFPERKNAMKAVKAPIAL